MASELDCATIFQSFNHVVQGFDNLPKEVIEGSLGQQLLQGIKEVAGLCSPDAACIIGEVGAGTALSTVCVSMCVKFATGVGAVAKAGLTFAEGLGGQVSGEKMLAALENVKNACPADLAAKAPTLPADYSANDLIQFCEEAKVFADEVATKQANKLLGIAIVVNAALLIYELVQLYKVFTKLAHASDVHEDFQQQGLQELRALILEAETAVKAIHIDHKDDEDKLRAAAADIKVAQTKLDRATDAVHRWEVKLGDERVSLESIANRCDAQIATGVSAAVSMVIALVATGGLASVPLIVGGIVVSAGHVVGIGANIYAGKKAKDILKDILADLKALAGMKKTCADMQTKLEVYRAKVECIREGQAHAAAMIASAAAVATARTGPTLKQKADRIAAELGLEPSTPANEIIVQACAQLGVETSHGSLNVQADRCLEKLL